MGVFLRSFHSYLKAGGPRLDHVVAQTSTKLGLEARVVEATPKMRKAKNVRAVVTYSPPGDWDSFYPDLDFNEEQIALLAKNGRLTAIYLFVYDSDNWGFTIFENGKSSFEWYRDVAEPESVSPQDVKDAQKKLGIFRRPISIAKLNALLKSDNSASEEKIFQLSDHLEIEGGGIGLDDFLEGTQEDLDLSKVKLIELRQRDEARPRKSATSSSKRSSSKAVTCDLVFIANWPANPEPRFRRGFYVIDAIVLIRDLLVGAEWVGRTLVEFAPGVDEELESTRKRIKLGLKQKLISKGEQPDFDEETWEEIVEAEPLTDSDLQTIARQIDKGKVAFFFADLDHEGSFVRYTADDRQAMLVAAIRETFRSDGTVIDQDSYDRFAIDELHSLVNSIYVKTRSEHGWLSVLKECEWDGESTDELNEWPPKNPYLVFLGARMLRKPEPKELDSIKGLKASRPKQGGLVIRVSLEPRELEKTEFQNSVRRLSRLLAELN